MGMPPVSKMLRRNVVVQQGLDGSEMRSLWTPKVRGHRQIETDKLSQPRFPADSIYNRGGCCPPLSPSLVTCMRYTVACFLATLLGAAGVPSSPKATVSSLTILFDFDGRYSQKSLQEMKRELATIMRGSGLQIDWRERRDIAPSESFAHLVVVTFRGTCIMEPIPFLYDERGPLAFTYSSDGNILPFGEVACNKVRSSIGKAMWGGDYGRSDTLFGRALARVLAHELYHMLAHTGEHAKTGVARHALSGFDLISEELSLNPTELNRIRTEMGVQDSPH